MCGFFIIKKPQKAFLLIIKTPELALELTPEFYFLIFILFDKNKKISAKKRIFFYWNIFNLFY